MAARQNTRNTYTLTRYIYIQIYTYTRAHIRRYVSIAIYRQASRAGYSLLEMRPAFASTSDPSGSRRATNRVTARDPRPKNPGSLPFLPSFLTLFRRATPLASLYLSSFRPSYHPSAFTVVIGFFLCSLAGRYNRGGFANRSLASRPPRRRLDGKKHGEVKREERKEKRRERRRRQKENRANRV